MTKKEKFKSIVLKIINRSNPSQYTSFDDLLEKTCSTVANGSKSSFLGDDEISFIKSDPKIYANILEICKSASKQIEEKHVNNHEKTIESILVQLNVHNTSSAKPPPNIEYIKKEVVPGNPIKGTIGELLLLLDLSPTPYQ